LEVEIMKKTLIPSVFVLCAEGRMRRSPLGIYRGKKERKK
jgi:hypothetical protein